jgi:hypothetical protein
MICMRRFLRSIFGLFLVAIFISGCDTSGNTDDPAKNAFIKYYGGDGDQSGADMVVLGDGNIILLGNTRMGTSKRIYFVKVDPQGNVITSKKLGDPTDVAIDIEPTGNGNFVILSRFERANENHDFKLLLVDDDGNKLDSVIYGFSKKDFPHSVTPLSDGGFIVTGGTQYEPTGFDPPDPEAYSNIFHLRCDATFDFENPLWEDIYGNPFEYDAGVKVFEGTNQQFYVFGYSTYDHIENPNGNLNLEYYSISATGSAADQPSFLGDYDQNTTLAHVLAAPPEFGGGFFQIATRTNNTGTVTLHVAKLRSPLSFNSDDELLDEEIDIIPRPLEAVSAAAAVNATPQGYLLLAEELRNLGTKNISLTKINQIGAVIWSVSLGSEEENDEAAAVAELADGKILVLGTVEIGDNQTKMALFKLNSTGRLHQ